jgi:hypothetical protein
MEDGVVSMNSLRGHAARSEIVSSLGIGGGVADPPANIGILSGSGIAAKTGKIRGR